MRAHATCAAAVVALGTIGVLEMVGRRAAAIQRDRAKNTATTAVVVLGFWNPEPTINATNRLRADMGLRVASALTGESTLVLCGGAVGGDTPEADLLAHYIRDVRGFNGPLELDRNSRTTRENVANILDILEKYERIVMVSYPLHAALASRYLRLMRPHLASRLARFDAYVPLETSRLQAIALGAYLKNRPITRRLRHRRTNRSPDSRLTHRD